jgi:colicin import membrane protein
MNPVHADVRIAAAPPEKGWRGRFGMWLLCSAILHALILPPLLLSSRPGQPALIIPLDVVVLADETKGPPRPETAVVPVQEAGMASSPAVPPAGVTSAKKPPDDFDIKLHALAQLRQPSVDTHLSKKTLGLASLSATSDNAAPGSYATYAVRDFIRAQVERRWGLDLPTLHGGNYSVRLRVEITSAGVVTRAEIADTARFNSDATYRAIALSARNALLLSSPLALPPGPYSDVMEFTLSLDTQEALR